MLEKAVDLLRTQPITGLDRSLTGHQAGKSPQSLFEELRSLIITEVPVSFTLKPTEHLLADLRHPALAPLALEELRHCPDRNLGLSKGLGLVAAGSQETAAIFQQGRLLNRERQDLGDHQLLLNDLTLQQLAIDSLEENLFVQGVLINQQDTVLFLYQDKGIQQLEDPARRLDLGKFPPCLLYTSPSPRD